MPISLHAQDILSRYALIYSSRGSFRGEKENRPKTQPEKVEDPGSATPLLYKSPSEIQGAEAQRKGISVKATCTDAMGMVNKQGDKGYEACLRNLDKLRPEKVDEKNPNSVGITIGN